MLVMSAAQSRKIEAEADRLFGLSGERLMQIAAVQAAEAVLFRLLRGPRRRRSVVVVAGSGNNGGDGIATAFFLAAHGVRPLTLVLSGPADKLSPLGQSYLASWTASGHPFLIWPQATERVAERLRNADMVIDALFGVGLHSGIAGDLARLVDAMNTSLGERVSLDLPSGLDADTGVVKGAVVRAHLTLSFGPPKVGYFLADGPSVVGEWKVCPLGYPKSLVTRIAQAPRERRLLADSMVGRLLPRRKPRSHKGDHGRVLVCGGQEGHWGAGLLAASAAYRVGAGFVTWASWTSPAIALAEMPEILTSVLTAELWERPSFAACLIGPGMGTGEPTARLLQSVRKLATPVILDADALTVAARERLWPVPEHWIITPHVAEAARILGISPSDIENDRIQAAERLADVTGATALLKGFRTVVASRARTWLLPVGNAALAKAGSGDVLAGFIVGLVAQGLSPIAAALVGAYGHGRIADEWLASGKDILSLCPSDLSHTWPHLLKVLRLGPLAEGHAERQAGIP